MLVREAIQASGIPKARLARDAGLSRAALNAWISGARMPQPESIRQLAEGLRSRAGRLQDLAAELERAAGEG
jgi:transcriptional regulator with XRE-family HTH domain